ncbi:MAG: hypothetical protein ABWX84_11400 [Nocardioides sp.]
MDMNLRRIGWPEYGVYVETPATPFGAAGFFVRSSPAHRSDTNQGRDSGGVKCGRIRHDIDFSNEVVRMRIPARCFDKPRWVKVTLANTLTTRGSAADTSVSLAGFRYWEFFTWPETLPRRLYRAATPAREWN